MIVKDLSVKILPLLLELFIKLALYHLLDKPVGEIYLKRLKDQSLQTYFPTSIDNIY